jgi:hypothetical protein
VLIPVMAGTAGTPVEGSSFITAYRFYTLDAAAGAAAVGKLKAAR